MYNLDPKINYPNIIICGSSGTGKSTSLRNLDPETTAIGNIERKPLPFKGWQKFKHHEYLTMPSDLATFVFTKSLDPKIEVIIIESFEAYSAELYKTSRAQFKGWDVINNYNKNVYDLLIQTKVVKGKFMVMLSSTEIINLTLPEGGQSTVRKAKLHGKELELESHFVMCLYTEVARGNTGMEYKFITNSDGIVSAKSPLGMFSNLKVDNDLNEVLKTVKKYYE